LEEKLTRLSWVARQTSNAVIISDAQGRISWANQSFTAITGYTLSEVIGKTPDFLHCEETDMETVSRALEAIRNHKAVRFEVLNRAKDGHKYWLDVDVQPLNDAGGNVVGFISVETDITEIKHMHEQLKKSENKLRAILDSTSDDNILVDADHRILSLNKVAKHHLKLSYGVEPQIGELIWNYVKKDMFCEFEQTFNQALAGFVSKKEYLWSLNHDKQRWFEFLFYPVYSKEGTLIGVAINSKNIHAKKIAELRVQHQNKKLKEIAFMQSHTLRRPVANIMGLWGLINEHHDVLSNNPAFSELIAYLGRSVNEVDGVIRNIIDNTKNMDV
jgi:PAS domain S-box-containing protein